MLRLRTTIRSRRVLAALRTAAPLAAMFLLTGNNVISCSGEDPADSDSGGGGSSTTRPASAAVGRWTPVPSVDTCTKAFHDTFTVVGPDGRRYPTWHPPTATDPDTGLNCSFGHEHGRNPAGSALWNDLRRHYAWDGNSDGTISDAELATSGVPFGYAAEQQRLWNAANGISNANREEDHVSYKIAWENGIRRTRTVNGVAQTFDLSCNALTMLHQESHSAESFASNEHDMIYAIDCSTGEDADTHGGKLIVSAMTTFGNPGEFTVRSDNDVYTTTRFGTPQPVNSVAGGSERGRVIPNADRVWQYILVPAGETSDFATGLTERWYAGLALTNSGGTQLAFVDPSFAVGSPSRYFNQIDPDATARSVNLCYIGITAGLVVINDPARAGEMVRRARGPECSAIAPQGPATPLASRIAYDSTSSPFNGCRRSVTLTTSRIANTSGVSTWYTNPYGANGRTTTFTGGVKQFISLGSNSSATDADSATFGADIDSCLTGSGIHAPN